MTTSESALPDIDGRTAIMAGSGRLPEVIADNLLERGKNPFVLAVSSEVGEWIERHDHAIVPFTHLSGLISALRAARVKNIVLAGGIKVRPTLRSFRLDWMTLKLLPRLFRALRKGDDFLLSVAINWLESFGFVVVGPHVLVPSLLTPTNVLTLLNPDGNDMKDALRAVSEARRLGLADIGQAAVAREGNVIALEDRRGTAAMLAGLAATAPGFSRSGVLAKFAKPQQETRVDLPAIGPETVEQVAAAGLAGIVVEAQRSLILDRDMTVAKANELGIFIVGMSG